ASARTSPQARARPGPDLDQRTPTTTLETRSPAPLTAATKPKATPRLLPHGQGAPAGAGPRRHGLRDGRRRPAPPGARELRGGGPDGRGGPRRPDPLRPGGAGHAHALRPVPSCPDRSGSMDGHARTPYI